MVSFLVVAKSGAGSPWISAVSLLALTFLTGFGVGFLRGHRVRTVAERAADELLIKQSIEASQRAARAEMELARLQRLLRRRLSRDQLAALGVQS